MKGESRRVPMSFTFAAEIANWITRQANNQGASMSEFLEGILEKERSRNLDNGNYVMPLPLSKAETQKALKDFCKRNGIASLSIFGSALSPNFGSESDFDFLVEFLPKEQPSFFEISQMELELSDLLEGREVELRTKEDLSEYFREQVIDSAQNLYEQAK